MKRICYYLWATLNASSFSRASLKFVTIGYIHFLSANFRCSTTLCEQLAASSPLSGSLRECSPLAQNGKTFYRISRTKSYWNPHHVDHQIRMITVEKFFVCIFHRETRTFVLVEDLTLQWGYVLKAFLPIRLYSWSWILSKLCVVRRFWNCLNFNRQNARRRSESPVNMAPVMVPPLGKWSKKWRSPNTANTLARFVVK